MIASRIFVKLEGKVESKSISCKILPISCLAAMSKKPKYSCRFQKEWRTEFDFVQLRKLLKISSGKNLQRIGAKTRKFEAGLLHFPQSYLASMA